MTNSNRTILTLCKSVKSKNNYKNHFVLLLISFGIYVVFVLYFVFCLLSFYSCYFFYLYSIYFSFSASILKSSSSYIYMMPHSSLLNTGLYFSIYMKNPYFNCCLVLTRLSQKVFIYFLGNTNTIDIEQSIYSYFIHYNLEMNYFSLSCNF